jgi:2,3-bisphosphoglycerate-dependent phosphoglycerate mutase
MRRTWCLVLALLVEPWLGAPPQASSSALHVYLARHGETDWNAEHRLQGCADRHLNDTGRAQASQLADRLAGLHFDAVYSSALARSRETAELVRGSVPLTVLDGLNERRLGAFEGRRIDATSPATAAEYARRSQDPHDALDGGESLTVFFERIQAAVAEILTRHPAGTILIVGHGGANQMIVRSLLGLSAIQGSSFQQANDELYLIQREPSPKARMWKLVVFDR